MTNNSKTRFWLILALLLLGTVQVSANTMHAELNLYKDLRLDSGEMSLSSRVDSSLYARIVVPEGFEAVSLAITSASVRFRDGNTEQFDSGEIASMTDRPLVRLSGSSGFRGHSVAAVVCEPILLDSANYLLGVIESVEFDLVLEPVSDKRGLNARYDDWTLRMLSRMVANPEVLQDKADLVRTTQVLSLTDSVPCIIITNEEMRAVFEDYAALKTKLGVNTEVQTIETISASYPGDSLQVQVRNYIRECYNDLHSDWVMIGGDVSIIPPMYANSLKGSVLTDTYYSNLDNEWNEDGDTLFGEVWYFGDTTDYYPDVFVGRIPCVDSAQASAILSKLWAYQADTTYTDYQARVLTLGTNIVNPGLYTDEYPSASRALLDSLVEYLPVTFTNTQMYEASSADVKSELNEGYGIITNSSQAQYAGNFLTHWLSDPWVREAVDYRFVADTMSNFGRYGFFFNITCFGAKLDEDEAFGRHFLRNPSGGGVGYMSSSFYTWSTTIYPDFHIEMYDLMFEQDMAEPARAMEAAKIVLCPDAPWDDNMRRSAIFSFLFLGDPQMAIWTDTPVPMVVSCPDEVESGTRDILVSVATSSGAPVADALVCMWLPHPQEEVYQLGYTDTAGEVVFEDVAFAVAGNVSIAATKQNHFLALDSFAVVHPDTGSGPAGCPKLFVWNGTQYEFQNNILAQSEDYFNDYGDDYYPVFAAPSVNGVVKLRVMEDENEESAIRQVKAYAVPYDVARNLAFTNENALRGLTGAFLSPVSALLNGKEDVTKRVSANDGMCLSVDEPGFVILRYADPRLAATKDRSQITLGDETGGGGIGVFPIDKGVQTKIAAGDMEDPVTKNIVYVYALNEDKDWDLVSTVYPRFNKFAYYTELQNYTLSDELTVKIEWTGVFDADYLPYAFFDEVPLTLAEVPLLSARHNTDGLVDQLFSDPSYGEVSLKPGEHIDLEFAVPSTGTDQRMALVLQVNGKYEAYRANASTDANITFDQNYPNPFNPTTTFSFSLSQPARVSVVVYNILGQEVKTLSDHIYDAGTHQVVWDGLSNEGASVASGVYFGRLKSGNTDLRRKLMLLR